MKPSEKSTKSSQTGRVLSSLIVLLCIVGGALGFAFASRVFLAQSTNTGERTRFDVVSIKSNKSGNQNPAITAPVGGRLFLGNVTMSQLTRRAYRLEEYQLSGQPSWFDTDRYDVEAKTEPSVPVQQMYEMLQTLLVDRLRLAFHRSERQFPAFALAVVKSGVKLRTTDPTTCATGLPEPCGVFKASPVEIMGHGVSISQFTTRLSTAVGQQVLDKTGLTGIYDIHLQWDLERSLDKFPVDGPTPTGPIHGSIFTAIQEELGLRLESDKASLEVLIIDHVERPSEN